MTEVADAIKVLAVVMTCIGTGTIFALLTISFALWGRR